MSENPTLPNAMFEKRVQQLAYEYWKQRGSPRGTPEVDWLRAEAEVKHEIDPIALKT
jgi:hypothetical protein